MPGGGWLTLRTRPSALARRGAVVFRRKGLYAGISVTDTGVGMDEKARRRSSIPFHHQGMGRGYGLGLAAVYGSSRGIAATSMFRAMEGSSFIIGLPKTTEMADRRRRIEGAILRTETVLLRMTKRPSSKSWDILR